MLVFLALAMIGKILLCCMIPNDYFLLSLLFELSCPSDFYMWGADSQHPLSVPALPRRQLRAIHHADEVRALPNSLIYSAEAVCLLWTWRWLRVAAYAWMWCEAILLFPIQNIWKKSLPHLSHLSSKYSDQCRNTTPSSSVELHTLNSATEDWRVHMWPANQVSTEAGGKF